MDFSSISNAGLVGRLLRLPLKLIPPQTKIPILQGRLKGRKWITGSGNHGYWLGSYEYDKQKFFEGVLTNGSIVFDVGANVGFYTLLASELVGPQGKVFAFEPLPQNLYYLKEHLRINRINNVTVIPVAVSDNCGSAFFEQGPNRSMGKLTSQGALKVNTVSLDDLIAKKQLPIPDYIKIDVEGAEKMVLVGAEKLLAENHPTCFLATHGRSIHQQCCAYLQSLNYHLTSVNERSVDETDEILAYYQGAGR